MRLVKAVTLIGGGTTLAVAILCADPSKDVDPSPSTAEASHVSEAAQFDALARAHDCHHAGLPAGEIPGSALLRTHSGAVAWVSFDRGWRSFQGAAPGQLLAVCRDSRG